MKELTMKLRLLTLLAMACMTTTLAAQDTAMVATVKGNVQKMMDATCTGDYNTVLDMTYPKVLEMMGGTGQIAQLKADGGQSLVNVG